MAELHPPEGPNDAAAATPATTTTAATTAAILPPSAENTIIATAAATTTTTATTTNNNNNLGPGLAPKRQRRPSVRLGEIGDQPATLSYDSQGPRRPKPWRFYKDPGLLAAKSSKTRPLTNLVNGHEILETAGDNPDFGHRKHPKSKRPSATTTAATKRVRTNWTVATKAANNGIQDDDNNTNTEEFRDFEPEPDPEGSESPLKEQSPLQSVDNAGLDFWHGHRRTGRARVSQDQDDGAPETSGDRNFGSGSERGRGRDRFLDDGVRNWLVGLGLGQYAPVFEIHEVDDQVLPMLTLEDLKDMGINAVGSRRKLYTAIQKLPKGFS